MRRSAPAQPLGQAGTRNRPERNRLFWGRERYSYYHLLADRPPQSTPMAFWRSVSRLKLALRATTLLILLSFGSVAVGAIVNLGYTQRAVERGGIVVVAVLLVVHTTVLLYGFRFATGRYRRFLTEHELRVCMRCGYVLAELPSSHKCPECGDGYDLTLLAVKWQEWLDSQIAYELPRRTQKPCRAERRAEKVP